MSHPFDVTLKELVEKHRADFAPVFGFPVGLPVQTLDADLSTLSAATDVAFGFGNPIAEITDINFQSGPDAFIDARLLLYNAALHHHYHVPVRSMLVLLRPVADHSRLTGNLAYTCGGKWVEFGYDVVRMWRQPVAPFLTGGLGLLPLATLCDLASASTLDAALKSLVGEIDRRLRTEATHADAVRLMMASYILAGMRAKRGVLSSVFRGVTLMQETTAWDEMLEEGELRLAYRWLLRQGQRRLGPVDEATEAAVRAIRDLDRLDRMADAVLTASNWPELLSTP